MTLITCTIEGILDEAELAAAIAAPAGEPAPRTTLAEDEPGSLKKLREKHHSVARLIASGLQQSLVASICGYTQSYLSVLLDNPAMQELISFYRGQQGEAQMVVVEKLRLVGLTATEQLLELLHSPPEGGVDGQLLLGIAKLGLDRGGHGPSSTVHKLNEHRLIDEAELVRLNLEARRRDSARIVNPEEVRRALPAPAGDDAEKEK